MHTPTSQREVSFRPKGFPMPRHLSFRLLLASVSLFVCSSVPALAQGADVPLSFEPNRGQADQRVEFLSHGKGYGFYLSRNAAVVQLGTGQIELRVEDGQVPLSVSGEQVLPGKVNYLRGTDTLRWLRGVPTYARVRMSSVYPGVD